MIRYLLIAGAAALLIGAAPAPHRAPIDPSMAGPTPTKLSGYLSADAVDGQTVIGPPPGPDSPRFKADRTVYLETRALAGSPPAFAADEHIPDERRVFVYFRCVPIAHRHDFSLTTLLGPHCFGERFDFFRA